MGSGTETVDGGLYTSEDRLQGKALENVHTVFVKPSSATPIDKEWLPLCNLDYFWMAFYTPLICTFTLTDDHVQRFGSVAGVVRHLKDSLADALVWFYPLAGRLLTTDGPPRIHCNDEGAAFTEASVNIEIADLKTEDFLPMPLLTGLAAAGFEHYPTLPQTPGGLPTLIVQVTHFKCGGIALAANWSHAVADGQSGLHFMKSWSELARGLKLSLLPDHRRDLIKPRDPLIPGNLVNPVAASPDAHRIAAEKAQQSSPPDKTTPEPKKPQIATRKVDFTKADVAKLRTAAADSHLTRADCFSTHLWRTMAKARNRPLDARARLWVLVEGRKKLSLPPGYFGNVICMAAITTTVRELLTGPFGATAALIHAGVASITEEWFQGFVDLIQASEGKNYFNPENLGSGSESGVSYLVRFPYYDLDFGFGTPACSMRNTVGAWEGLVFVLPSSRGPDHMVAMPNLQPDDLSGFIAMAHDLPEAKP